jgi:uncharacterized protein (TIGR03067 family)
MLILVLGMPLIASSPTIRADETDDAKLIQGTWKIDPATYKDEKDKDRREELALWRVIFEGDVMTLKHPIRFEEGGKKGIEMKIEEGPFGLVKKETPKQINLYGEMADVLAGGIYELNGDRLKLCWHRKLKKRPTKFETGKDGAEPFLLLLIREKKKD